MRSRSILGLTFLALTVTIYAASENEVFENNCAACHGTDGRARTPQGRKLKARDLKESRLTDDDLLRRIREGSRNPKGIWLMPAFAETLTEAEIQSAARTAKSFRPPPPAP